MKPNLTSSVIGTFQYMKQKHADVIRPGTTVLFVWDTAGQFLEWVVSGDSAGTARVAVISNDGADNQDGCTLMITTQDMFRRALATQGPMSPGPDVCIAAERVNAQELAEIRNPELRAFHADEIREYVSNHECAPSADDVECFVTTSGISYVRFKARAQDGNNVNWLVPKERSAVGLYIITCDNKYVYQGVNKQVVDAIIDAALRGPAAAAGICVGRDAHLLAEMTGNAVWTPPPRPRPE